MKWERVQFLTVEEVIDIHDHLLSETGGTAGILSVDGLESAVMSPQATFGGQPLLETLAEIAAAYIVYLATSHPFTDGNKRTAITAAAAFLDVNGYPLKIADDEEWAVVMERVATDEISQRELAELLASAMGDWGELEWR